MLFSKRFLRLIRCVVFCVFYYVLIICVFFLVFFVFFLTFNSDELHFDSLDKDFVVSKGYMERYNLFRNFAQKILGRSLNTRADVFLVLFLEVYVSYIIKVFDAVFGNEFLANMPSFTNKDRINLDINALREALDQIPNYDRLFNDIIED